ncbi:MAG: gliding motility-associated C-terminal domain-containing protein [Bacteroidetes bacterium]|nr:gliding motility-associated C-terminal domain-containing protein [Bacteroidota bacterium]
MEKVKLILLLLLFPLGLSAQLNAGVDDTINPGVPVTLTAAYGLVGTGINTTDDGVEGPFPIGFEFTFFGNKYTQFYVGSNGWIGFTFNTRYIGISEPYRVPSPNEDKNPRDCILGPFIDLNPIQAASPYIFYRTLGKEPTCSLVVMWCDCPMNSCLDSTATFQIILNEGSNTIENHIMNKPYCDWHGNRGTLGLQNKTGTIGFPVPGYNATAWTMKNMAFKYTPVTVDSFQIARIPYDLKPITPGNKVSYRWFQAGDEISEDQTIIVTPLETTTYIANAKICAGEEFYDTVTVYVHQVIPNAFTPNDDGLNDRFKILGLPAENITRFQIQIFDRWGQVVYESNNIEEGWDGTFKGKLCPPETYNWIIHYETNSRKDKISNKGQVMLIR